MSDSYGNEAFEADLRYVPDVKGHTGSIDESVVSQTLSAMEGVAGEPACKAEAGAPVAPNMSQYREYNTHPALAAIHSASIFVEDVENSATSNPFAIPARYEHTTRHGKRDEPIESARRSDHRCSTSLFDYIVCEHISLPHASSSCAASRAARHVTIPFPVSLAPCPVPSSTYQSSLTCSTARIRERTASRPPSTLISSGPCQRAR